MHYDKPESRLIFISYRINAQPMDDFLITEDENTSDIKRITTKR